MSPTFVDLLMASCITKLAFLLKKGRVDEARASVEGYRHVISASVGNNAEKCVLHGTVLHVSKSKKVGFFGKMGEKRTKKEVTYFRLVFCR